MLHKAIDIANAFLALSEPDKGDIVSNLKLQKLLYYIQGFNLAMYGEQLFKEDVVAWQYGPVVKEVYYEFKEYGSAAIPVPEKFDFSIFSDPQLELIKEVNEVYGQFSALRLMEMTHKEKPWLETPINGIISKDVLKQFFSTLIVNE